MRQVSNDRRHHLRRLEREKTTTAARCGEHPVQNLRDQLNDLTPEIRSLDRQGGVPGAPADAHGSAYFVLWMSVTWS